MPTFRTIGGFEPSTITFSLDVVQIARNGSNVLREIQVIGDPDTSNANAAVVAATPGSTAWGLVVRPIFSSSGVDNPVVVQAGNSSVTIAAGNSSVIITAGNSSVTVSNQVRVSNSTAGDLLVRPVFSSTAADNKVSAVPPQASTAANSNVIAGSTSVTLLSSNASRIAAIITNDANGILYVKYGATAASTSYTWRLASFDAVREESYNGLISGIWVTGSTGLAIITELTP